MSQKTTLEELVVRLEAENKTFIAAMNASTKATEQAMGKIQDSLKDMADKGTKEVSRLERVMETAMGFITGEAIIGGIHAVKDALLDFAKAGIEGANESEDAMNRFANAIAANGNYSREAADDMDAFAASLQATTRYGDDAIVTSASLIATLGKLSGEGLKEATQAALDLSAGLGIDLQTATMMVGKAAAGEIATFKRYGIAVEEGSTKAETFANMLQAISHFSGRAKADVNTFSGATTLLGNNWGELSEAVMKNVTQNVAVIGVMKTLNDMIVNTTENIDGNKQGFRTLVAEGLVTFLDTSMMVVTAFDAIVRATTAAWRVLEGYGMAYGAIASSIVSITDGEFSQAANTLKTGFSEAFEKAGTSLDAFSEDTKLGDLAVKMGELGESARDGLEQVKAGMESGVEPTNNLKTKMEELAEAQRKVASEGRTFAEEAIIAMEEDSEIRSALLQERHDAEVEKMNTALAAKQLSQEEYNLAIRAMDEKRVNEEAARDEKRKKQELERDQQKLQAASQFFGGMASLARAGGAETFGIGKRLAQAQALVDGYAAVQNTLASVPYPFNLVAAAGIGAQTAANVAQIEAQQFNTGGTVPGIGFKDTVPAMLTPGEEVVNKSTSNLLREFLNGQTSGTGSSQEIRVTIGFSEQAFELIEQKLIERGRLGLAEG